MKIPPCLMLPKPKDDDDTNNHHHRFFSLYYKKSTEEFYKFDTEIIDQHETLFLGSSSSCLVILNKSQKNSFLLNPFSRQKLHLPSIKTLPPTTTSQNRHYFLHNTNHNTFVSKAIVVLSVSDSGEDKKKERNDNNTWVVIIHGYVSRKLAYCKAGGDTWTNLEDSDIPNMSFCDILGHRGRLYALSSSNTVQVWDFQSNNSGSFPTKVMSFVPSSQPCLGLDSGKFLQDRYFCQSYLVESMGGFLLVTRIVGNFVNSDGELLDEADLLDDESTHPLICPYATVAFCVHKMKMNEWEKVDSLGGRAVFVGGSESMSCSTEFLPEYHGNSIYFTDDNWDEMTTDYLYGGHDNGVYSMDTKAVEVEPWLEIHGHKINPPPLWLLPRLY
ncbi:putative F-box protein At5g55150 [Humulus lupulus]|uniref:putative F-box protein At5g55150 n=1 Tax=Humulus lupulus TaxID=3486 RepID=UPI002B411373|nr:putative F-box protein At5g55150 [Humulus lupulus]